MKKIILAGGCFWGVEAYFQRLAGIKETVVGYIDGHKASPSYEEVCNGSGHAEAVLINYDESMVTLKEILLHLFRIIDPTQRNRQGHDIGIQYRSAIYYSDLEDKLIAEQVIEAIRPNYRKPIQTQVLPATTFYPAESYHQKYLDKHPNGYCHVDLSLADKPLDWPTFKLFK